VRATVACVCSWSVKGVHYFFQNQPINETTSLLFLILLVEAEAEAEAEAEDGLGMSNTMGALVAR
jgi:hypothetical protein